MIKKHIVQIYLILRMHSERKIFASIINVIYVSHMTSMLKYIWPNDNISLSKHEYDDMIRKLKSIMDSYIL